MTEHEITESYRTAKYKMEQLRVLADLNQCGVQDIRDVLVKAGYNERELHPTNWGKAPARKAQKAKPDEPTAPANGETAALVRALEEQINKKKRQIMALIDDTETLLDAIRVLKGESQHDEPANDGGGDPADRGAADGITGDR